MKSERRSRYLKWLVNAKRTPPVAEIEFHRHLAIQKKLDEMWKEGLDKRH